MKEVKHTPGPWIIEEIYPDGDFQCRIIARGVLNGGINGPQDAIIVGEPSKRGGGANIHYRANAELIASAPETAAERDKLKEEVEILINQRDTYRNNLGLMEQERDRLKEENERLEKAFLKNVHDNAVEKSLRDLNKELTGVLQGIIRDLLSSYNCGLVTKAKNLIQKAKSLNP